MTNECFYQRLRPALSGILTQLQEKDHRIKSLEEQVKALRLSGGGGGCGGGMGDNKAVQHSLDGAGGDDLFKNTPQDIALSVPKYGLVKIGSTLIIGKHRPVNGDCNWSEQMEKFVGKTLTVTNLSGLDRAGCPGVRGTVDGEHCSFFFRIRDCRLLEA